jgi:hypothetical protein
MKPGFNQMKTSLLAVLGCLALAACAGSPESTSQQADDAACTQQADAQYQQNTIDEAGHTAQNGLLYGATPTHVFDAERLGAMHQRDSQLLDCEETGNNNGQPEVNGVPVVTPHIIN